MFLQARRQSNLREYFLYFLIFSSAVIIIAGGFYFYFSHRMLRETSIKNREESLVLMQNTFENIISQIDNSINISQSYLRQYRNYFEEGRYSLLLNLHAELGALTNIRYIHNVSIYYRDWGHSVSTDLGVAGFTSIDFNPDVDFLKSIDSMGIRFRSTLFRMKPLRGGESLVVFSIIRSIPVFYPTEFPEAWVVIDIDFASLSDTMENIFNVTDSLFSVISADGMPLVSIGSAYLMDVISNSKADFPAITSQSGIMRIDNPDNLVLYLASGEQEWSFVYIEPFSSISRDWFRQFLISAAGATVFIILVCILGSFIFSRRIFNPIKAIFERTNIAKETTQKLKETDLILKKIDEIIEYNNRLEQMKINFEKNEIDYPISIENEIYRAFRDGDMDKLREAANSFRLYYVEKNAELEKIHSAYLRLFCASEVFIPGGFSHGNDNPDFRQIYTFSSIDEIHDWIIEWFSRAFYILHANKRTQTRLLRDICRYIDSNLGEDITAKGLWQRFEYHPSSLRKLFREELNLTLKSYVDNKRIEKAKELLMNTNQKIQDIAVQVGYFHTQSFIAFFNQNVHCTPMEFRRRNVSLN